MATRLDRWQARYIDTQPVASSGTLTGPNLLLDGASGVSIQVVLTNGAAGTLYVDATNADTVVAAYATVTNQAVPANGTGYFTYSLVDQLTTFAAMRVRFVASAAGNVSIATNIRRTYP